MYRFNCGIVCVCLFIQLRLFGFNFRPCVILFDFAFYFSRVLGHDIISRNEPPPSECLTLLSDHTAEQKTLIWTVCFSCWKNLEYIVSCPGGSDHRRKDFKMPLNFICYRNAEINQFRMKRNFPRSLLKGYLLNLFYLH